MPDLEYIPMMLGERPLCVWEVGFTERAIEFLQGLDPGYFEFVALTMGPLLETDDRQRAAALLRSTYSHGLETLFGLLAASRVRFDVIPQWMVLYQNQELKDEVRSMSYRKRGQELVVIAKVVFAQSPWKEDETAERFGKLWLRFAHDFLDDLHDAEYNSFKHGMRTRFGGFSLAMGVEDVPGVPAPAHKMRKLVDSEYGSKFYVKEKLDENDKFNLRIKAEAVNWNPEKYLVALPLLSMSIKNVVSCCLQHLGVESEDIEFERPDRVEVYEMPWERRPAISRFSPNPFITVDTITPLSKEEIREALRPTGES